MGATPEIPKPDKSLIPTLKIATAVGWSGGSVTARRSRA